MEICRNILPSDTLLLGRHNISCMLCIPIQYGVNTLERVFWLVVTSLLATQRGVLPFRLYVKFSIGTSNLLLGCDSIFFASFKLKENAWVLGWVRMGCGAHDLPMCCPGALTYLTRGHLLPFLYSLFSSKGIRDKDPQIPAISTPGILAQRLAKAMVAPMCWWAFIIEPLCFSSSLLFNWNLFIVSL